MWMLLFLKRNRNNATSRKYCKTRKRGREDERTASFIYARHRRQDTCFSALPRGVDGD